MNSIREIPPEYLNLCPIVDDKYKVLFKLGSGRFSKVKMAIKLDTNERVALKIMNEKIVENSSKREFQANVLSMFLEEIRMCLRAKHKYIVQIIDFKVGGVYRTSHGKVKRILYYVMKMADNGQLYRIIKESDRFSEKAARSIFRQLVTGVEHLHELGISHRDIKPENILIDRKMNIKIADFGFSCYFLNSHTQKIEFNASDAVGSLKYNAPQQTNFDQLGSYHADQIDLFACGCLLFEMVMKSPPFKSSNYNDTFYHRLIKSGDKNAFWDIFSSNCSPSQEFRDLIQKLLDPNPKIRLSLKELKEHPWLQGEYPTRSEFKKDLTIKLKKVTGKVRKEQQDEIKTFFRKEKSFEETERFKYEVIPVSREVEKNILELLEIIRANESLQNSDSSSNVDAKDLKQLKKEESRLSGDRLIRISSSTENKQ